MYSSDAAALRLKAILEADPGALIRLLQLFQIRNVTPLQVRSRRLGLEYLEAEIEVDGAEMTPEILRLIAAKAAELPVTLTAVVLVPEATLAVTRMTAQYS
jgi:prephenate dehydratase